MVRQIGEAYQQAAVAALEERIGMLEGRVAALADVVGILARGLEDLPTAEPGQRRTTEAARRAHELLMTELRPPRGPGDAGPAAT